jgi:transposase
MVRTIHTCGCSRCLDQEDHPDREQHHQMNLLLSRLDEQQRRWFAAIEAQRLGHGGLRLVALITGLDDETIRRGRRELADELATRPEGRIRQTGGGRPRVEDQDPGLLPALQQMLEAETAGDPMSARKWTRSTLRRLRARLANAGHEVSAGTVGRLLKAQGYSLKVNAKRREAHSEHPDRE